VSIRELAKRADVAPSTVWRIEKGRLDPTVGMLERLLRAAARESSPMSPTREAAVSLALGRLTAAELLQDPDRVLERARRRTAAMLGAPD
jgi:transcriptional regulator with XRE-family HTH domain